MPGPRSPDYYKLPGCRLFYGVDYGRYMFALAREIGAIPNLWSWSLKNPRVAFASAFGQAHVPIFDSTDRFELQKPRTQSPKNCCTRS